MRITSLSNDGLLPPTNKETFSVCLFICPTLKNCTRVTYSVNQQDPEILETDQMSHYRR